MENSAVPNPDNDLDAIPINEQELYDWGIEHRLDQYYGSDQAQNQYQYQPQINNNSGKQPPVGGYVLPDHVQDGNGYMVMSHDQKPAKIPGQTLLPISPIPQGQVVKGSVNEGHKKYKQPLIKPNGVPGRRPMLPTVDMDANELLKVERKRARNRVAASKCRMRKLERIAVLDQQANQLRNENENLAKLTEKLRAQVYGLKQELRWHLNNGCRIAHSQNLDHLDQQEHSLVPSTMDKSTETTNSHFSEHLNFQNSSSPDSTTSSISVKKEPIYESDQSRRCSL